MLKKKSQGSPPWPLGLPGAWANAPEPQAGVSVAGWGRWDCARGGLLLSCCSRLPRPDPVRDTAYLFGEGAIPPGILSGYPGGDTLAYPSHLGYPLPWEARGRLGQTYHLRGYRGAFVRNNFAGRRLKDGPPSRPTDPISELKQSLNGTLTCEGPFYVDVQPKRGGNITRIPKGTPGSQGFRR